MCFVSQEGPSDFIPGGHTHGTPSISEGDLVALPFLGTQCQVPGTTNTLAFSRPFEIDKEPSPTQAGTTCKGLLRDHRGMKRVLLGLEDGDGHCVCHL